MLFISVPNLSTISQLVGEKFGFEESHLTLKIPFRENGDTSLFNIS